MTPVIAAALLALAGVGTVVVLTRDPLRQAIVSGAYGMVVTVVFLLLRAPDVALSAVVVAMAASPLLFVLTIARIRTLQEKER